MLIVLGLEPFAKEISNVPEDDQDQIRQICCEQVVVWRLVLWYMLEWLSLGVPSDILMARVAERTELSVLTC